MPEVPDQTKGASRHEELRQRVAPLLRSLVYPTDAGPDPAFDSLMARAGDLWKRKQAMEGTKSETRDLLGEVFFSRLRRAFRDGGDPKAEIQAAEWVLRMVFSGTALSQFATALDRAMLEASRPEDFSFAGRADFISVEEVLQLLSGGAYSGMLGIEKDDNRIDVYIQSGKIVLLDPHHLIRRVLPGASNLKYREIPADLIRKAEVQKADTGEPLLLALAEFGFLETHELPELMQLLGLEAFYEFLAEQGACTFFYKKLDAMSDWVKDYGREMPVTPILLEGSKKIDDWRVMRQVFPDPDSALIPVDDMFARIASMDLGVLEIKLLAMIDGEVTPRQLAPAIGLPLFEVYEYLVRYAREGVLVPDGRTDVLEDISFGLEETMEKAFQALNANDDGRTTESALDGVFLDAAADSQPQAEEETFLDILANADFEKRG